MFERVHDPTHPSRAPVGAYVVPPGVLVPPDASLASFQRFGLYPEQGARSEYCCFTASNVTMRVVRPAGARVLQALVYIPRWPLFRKEPQSISAFVGSGDIALSPVGADDGLKPGLHRVRWALPPVSSAGVGGDGGDVVVRLHAGVSVVPQRVGVGVDKRVLGFVLVAIRCI